MTRRRFLWLLPVVFIALSVWAIGKRGSPAQVIPPLQCGNAVVDPGEECDPPGSSCITGLACDAGCRCQCPLPEQHRVEYMDFAQAQYEYIWPPRRFRATMAGAGTPLLTVPVIVFQSRDPGDNRWKVYIRKQGAEPLFLAETGDDIDADSFGNDHVVVTQDQRVCTAVGVTWETTPVIGAPSELPGTAGVRCGGTVTVRVLSPTRVVAVWTEGSQRNASMIAAAGIIERDAAGAPAIEWGPLVPLGNTDATRQDDPISRPFDVVVRSDSEITIVGRNPTLVAARPSWVTRILAWFSPTPPPIGTSSVWARDCIVGDGGIGCEDVGDTDLGRAGSEIRAARLAGGSIVIAPSYSDLPAGGQGAGVLVENAGGTGGWGWTPLPEAGTHEVGHVVPVALTDGRLLVSYVTFPSGSSAVKHLVLGSVESDDIAWTTLQTAPFSVDQAPPDRPELPLYTGSPAEFLLYNLPRVGDATTFSVRGGVRQECVDASSSVSSVESSSSISSIASSASSDSQASSSEEWQTCPPRFFCPVTLMGGSCIRIGWDPPPGCQVEYGGECGIERCRDTCLRCADSSSSASSSYVSTSSSSAASLAPLEWNAIPDMTFGSNIAQSVTFGGGKFVAVGNGGKGATSLDGVTWTAINDMKFGTDAIFSVTYGNGRFVAVGNRFKGSWSADGVTWTAIDDMRFGPADNVNLPYINSVAYGNGKFVAAGVDGKASWSVDGITWTAIDDLQFGTDFVWSVAYGNGKFVAVGTSSKASWSVDGVTWTAINDMKFGYTHIRSVAFGNGRFMAVAGIKGSWSADGITWTPAASDVGFTTGSTYAVAFGNDRFVALSGYSDAKGSYSADGVTWTPISDMKAPSLLLSVAYGNGKFVAVGNDGRGSYSGPPVPTSSSSSSSIPSSASVSSSSWWSSASSDTSGASSSQADSTSASSGASSIPSSSSSAAARLCGNFSFDAGEGCEIGIACPDDFSCNIDTCACEAEGDSSSQGTEAVCGNSRLEPGEDCEAGVDLPESPCKGSAQCNLQQCRCPPGQSKYNRKRGRR